ncbi:MAG TPA: HAD hydrolase family protein [Solirubrobacterales bacterium]|nr:HAD hydrolase family protein [Solirubrobacterales bacterium]
MGLKFDVPGEGAFEIGHLVFDVNGTLTDRGKLIPGVRERIGALRDEVEIRLLSADTYGTLDDLADELGVEATRIATGMDKADLVRGLGGGSCAAVGNGRNDVEMLAEVRLGIAVIGPEGASPQALAAARVVTGSIAGALDLLADPKAMAATLRR